MIQYDSVYIQVYVPQYINIKLYVPQYIKQYKGPFVQKLFLYCILIDLSTHLVFH
jgi:hypothetical protein